MKRTAALTAIASLAGLAGYSLHAYASGVPSSQPLWYSGTVSDAKGSPIADGNHRTSVALFEEQEPTPGHNPVCQTEPSPITFVGGRFRMDVSSCAADLQKNPDLFVELTVDVDGSGGKPFQRAKIGAVPFALEAQHAVNGVPPGGIVMFAGSCPAGWTEYTALRGRFPRGEAAGDAGKLDQGGNDDAVVVEHSHTLQANTGSAGDHQHSCQASTASAGTHSHLQSVAAPVEAIGCNQGTLRLDWAQDHGGCPLPQTGVNTADNGAHSHSASCSTGTTGSHAHSLSGATSSAGVNGTGRNVPRFQEVIFCVKQ